MRVLIVTLMLHLFCTLLSAQSPATFSINGRFKSPVSSGMIYLYYPVNDTMRKDSFRIQNDTFRFSGRLLHAVPATLSFEGRGKDVFIEPKTLHISLSGADLTQVNVAGSKSQNEFLEITSKVAGIDRRWKVVFDTLDAVNTRSNAAFQELKSWVLQPYFAEVREAYDDFFKRHPQSFVTAYYLSLNIMEANQGAMPDERLQQYYSGFEPTIKNSSFGKKIKAALASRKVGVPGTAAIDFTHTDWKSRPLNLASFRGKYVLLDFWGSWCVPCRKGHPALKALYERYKEKGFDIIGIAKDDDTKAAWHKAIEKDALPWHHILVGDLDVKYNVNAYPTKILVDPNGKIAGRYGEDINELDKKLASLLTLP